MYPARTAYKLVSGVKEYQACHTFMAAECKHPLALKDQVPPPGKPKFCFPTVYAERDKKLVGLMASQLHKRLGLIVCPIHISYALKNHVPVALRLIEAYEGILRQAEQTNYHVVSPAFKPSGRRIWEELRHAELIWQSADKRLNLYLVTLV